MSTVRDSRFGVALGGSYRQIADDFAGLDAPKLKFNFTISFVYTSMMSGAEKGNEDPYKISFGVKQCTRPSPNVIFEDINFYNFTTKVATRVDYGVMTVTLYDDGNNKAHGIFQSYMESISPLTKMTRDQASTLDRYGQSTASALGPMAEDARHGPIKSIRINHITNSRGRQVVYDFLNPKIQNVTLDELDMTQSDVNTLTFTFIYDSYNITTNTINGAATMGAATSAADAARDSWSDLAINNIQRDADNSAPGTGVLLNRTPSDGVVKTGGEGGG